MRNLKSVMTPAALRRYISRLSPEGRVTASLHRALSWEKRDVWYRTQKEHWLGWLREYDGPGAYRRADCQRTAEFIYNHIQCAPMLMWFAEAAGASRAVLVEAMDAVLTAGKRDAAMCAAARRFLPWRTVEPLLRRSATSPPKRSADSHRGPTQC